MQILWDISQSIFNMYPGLHTFSRNIGVESNYLLNLLNWSWKSLLWNGFKVVFEHLFIYDGKDCWKSASGRQVILWIFWKSIENISKLFWKYFQIRLEKYWEIFFPETWDNTTKGTLLLLSQITWWSDLITWSPPGGLI